MSTTQLLQSLAETAFVRRLPHSVRRAVRTTLERVGLYDQRLLHLRVGQIMANDMFLASYPKSGNTWLRFLIANLVANGEEVTFRNIDRFVPNPERYNGPSTLVCGRRVIKTHYPYFSLFPSFVYVVRDPRDVVVSYYHYCVKNKWFRGSLSSFVRTPAYCGDWGEHVRGALSEIAKRADEAILVRYEDMLEDCRTITVRLGAFLKLPTTSEDIDRAVEATAFDRLRANEARAGGELGPQDRGFFRAGKSGQWKEELASEEVSMIETKYGDLLDLLGYERCM